LRFQPTDDFSICLTDSESYRSKEVEGRSKRTTDWYRANLHAFSESLGQGDVASADELSLAAARSFVAQLQASNVRYENHNHRPTAEGGLSAHTINGYVRTLKAFGSWLREEGMAAEHPFEQLKSPKLPQTIIEILSDEEISRLLLDADVQISMDGKGRALDNILTERLWRSIRYEEVYLNDYANPKIARRGLAEYLHFYDYHRLHQALRYQTPAAVYCCHADH
jgi:site-specific recombinase XerC